MLVDSVHSSPDKTVSVRIERTYAGGSEFNDCESVKITVFVSVEVEGGNYEMALNKASYKAMETIAFAAKDMGIDRPIEAKIERLFMGKPIKQQQQSQEYDF